MKRMYKNKPVTKLQMRIILLIEKTPMTSMDIHKKLGGSHEYLAKMANNIRDKGIIHVSSWIRIIGSNNYNYPLPVFSIGEGIDCEKPGVLTGPERYRLKIDRMKVSSEIYSQYMTKVKKKRDAYYRKKMGRYVDSKLSPSLSDPYVTQCMPGTAAEISKKSGVCRSTVNTVIKRLMGKKEVFIISWKKVKNVTSPIYANGNSEDKKKPPPQSRSCISKRYNMNKKSRIESSIKKPSFSEKILTKINKSKAFDILDQARKKKNSWMSALVFEE